MKYAGGKSRSDTMVARDEASSTAFMCLFLCVISPGILGLDIIYQEGPGDVHTFKNSCKLVLDGA